ncbi:MAG: hypothetical protein GXP29_12600 [Planctomycetes bacterium]|nr:hypothetical protein [Planctomycetota bacterium]
MALLRKKKAPDILEDAGCLPEGKEASLASLLFVIWCSASYWPSDA